jgi:phospholipid/cholesterol/gamma-HCH transport system substrate-binding protein
MKRFNVEVSVGLFVVLGVLALGYLSVQLGQIQLVGGHTYTLTAVFPTVAGLRIGASVEIAGVQIGRIQDIHLEDFEAIVSMRIDKSIRLRDDAVVSVRTRGLIGEKYLRITQGGSEKVIPEGGRIREVEPPVDFEELIGHFIQGKI